MRAVRSAQVQRSGATGRRSGRKALTNAPVRATLTPIGWLLGECRLRDFGKAAIRARRGGFNERALSHICCGWIKRRFRRKATFAKFRHWLPISNC